MIYNIYSLQTRDIQNFPPRLLRMLSIWWSPQQPLSGLSVNEAFCQASLSVCRFMCSSVLCISSSASINKVELIICKIRISNLPVSYLILYAFAWQWDYIFTWNLKVLPRPIRCFRIGSGRLEIQESFWQQNFTWEY